MAVAHRVTPVASALYAEEASEAGENISASTDARPTRFSAAP